VAVSLSLIGLGVLQAVIYLLFIRAMDLYERESLFYVIPVFVWGATVAVVISLLFNTLAALTLSTVVEAPVVNFLTAVFVAPVVEEGAKGLALLLTFLVAYMVSRAREGAIEFSGVMDGIVYGSAVGFGFSIAEDIIYYLQFGPETFLVRRIFGGFAHAAFASLTGVGIGLIPWVRFGFLKLLLPLIGLSGAILLHGAFNFTATLFGPLAYALMAFVILAYVILIAVWLAVERGVIRDQLREEVSAGTVTPGEYAILPTYFRRTGYYLGLILSGRLGTWRKARKLHRTAVDLAFTKRLARTSYTPYEDSHVRRLRERIRRIRGPELRAAEP
jgi:RsiW-degrading membrane proteinase PrsW (M82 family)